MTPCYKCGSHNTKDTWWRVTVEEESGRSGGSWTFGGRSYRGSKRTSKSNSIFYNTGKKYYRNRVVFVCDDCHGSFGSFMKNLFSWMILLFFILLFYYKWRM